MKCLLGIVKLIANQETAAMPSTEPSYHDLLRAPPPSPPRAPELPTAGGTHLPGGVPCPDTPGYWGCLGVSEAWLFPGHCFLAHCVLGDNCAQDSFTCATR